MRQLAVKTQDCLKVSSLILLLFALGSAQCKKNESLKSPKDPQQTDANSQDAKDEKVDIPANIAGSYLTCAIRKEAKASDLDTEYGCRLTDAGTQKKLDLAAASKRLSWAANIETGVKVTEQDAASIYHVYLNVSGPSLAAIAEISKNLKVLARWQLDSGQTIPVKQDNIGNVLKPAIELEDFEAPIVREQSIQTDRPGSL